MEIKLEEQRPNRDNRLSRDDRLSREDSNGAGKY